jgi:hypothetical protein
MTAATTNFLRTRLLPTISLAAALLFANLSHANQDPPPPVERSTPEARLLRATEAAGLPPIPSNRADVSEYYQLDFLPDGYPGRRTDEGTVPHPIYGSYLIAEYLSAYRRSGSKEMLDAACRMADVALSRMDRVGEMTVFTYRPEWKLDSTTQPYVSGLTQSHYLHQLAELHDITGIARYSEAAQSIFKSLTTSVESGGVLAKTSRGVVIEESPHSPRDIVLNGWLTAIRNIRRYEARTGSKAAQDLVNANLKTLSRLLPLYDVPALANTRYRIRGFAYVRLRFESTDGVILQDASLDIPGESTHPVRPDYLDRWHSGFMRGVEPIADGLQVIAPQVQLNLVLSLLSAPEPNRLSMRISALSAGRCRPGTYRFRSQTATTHRSPRACRHNDGRPSRRSHTLRGQAASTSAFPSPPSRRSPIPRTSRRESTDETTTLTTLSTPIVSTSSLEISTTPSSMNTHVDGVPIRNNGPTIRPIKAMTSRRSDTR